MTEIVQPPLDIKRRGLMLVLSSPSGAGKSTIAHHLLESDPRFSLSVSVTTRQRRGSEIEGRDAVGCACVGDGGQFLTGGGIQDGESRARLRGGLLSTEPQVGGQRGQQLLDGHVRVPSKRRAVRSRGP